MSKTDNPKIDFEILNIARPTKLVIADSSLWGFIEEKPSVIEIIPPMKDIGVSHYFNKNQNNIFNSSNLYLSEVGLTTDLPDGVYTITLKGSDCHEVSKYYLRTESIEIRLAKAYLQTDFLDNSKDTEIKDFLSEIRSLIAGANSAVKFGELVKGTQILSKANEYLKNYEQCGKKDKSCL